MAKIIHFITKVVSCIKKTLHSQSLTTHVDQDLSQLKHNSPSLLVHEIFFESTLFLDFFGYVLHGISPSSSISRCSLD